MKSERKRDYWKGFGSGITESLVHPIIAYRVVSDDEIFRRASDREMSIYNAYYEPLFGVEPKIKNREDFFGGVRTGVYAGHAIGLASFGLANILVSASVSIIRKDLVLDGRYTPRGWDVFAGEL